MSSIKKLLPSTIISREFYVERGADKQIRDVVRTMGRPGYVLVARQMGKTNLLLNAKNQLGDGGTIFVYVDLSNEFPDLYQFFRNIVDVAIDSNPECFFGIEEKLNASRNINTNRPAHKEHEQELRLLLRATEGKIVICLDEIDALKKVNYSDSVFSQIRSTYFASRINYPEFKNLTYILSGVVEPNDIIKNKDISPFNIGEKIYLNDFSWDEYFQFITKADLNFSDNVVERIYFWTNGNPRMCWDLCSGLEDIALSDVALDVEVVDSVVRKLYLTAYNLPPVDHIRQQVTEDKDLRNAIMNIHLEKSISVNDAQRTKLYLAGIIGSDFSSSNLSIKNRIIQSSLSESWLMSIEESASSVLEKADVRYNLRDFPGALKLYVEYLDNLEDEVADKYIYFKAGECCLFLQDYKGVVSYFEKANIRRSESEILYFRKLLWLGIAQAALDEVEKSEETFNRIIKFPFDEERPIVYYEALINICVCYFKNFSRCSDKIIENCKEVISEEFEIRRLQSESHVKIGNVESLMFAAFRNLSYAYELLDNRIDAKRFAIGSIDFAAPGGKLGVISELLAVSEGNEALLLLNSAKDLLNSEGSEFNHNVMSPESKFNSQDYVDLLVSSIRHGGFNLAIDFIGPLLSGKYGERAIWSIISAAANKAVSDKNFDSAAWLYKIALKLPTERLNLGERRSIYSQIIINGPETMKFEFEGSFLSELSHRASSDIDEHEVRVLYELMKENIEDKNFYRVEAALRVMSRKRAEIFYDDPSDDRLIGRIFLPIDYLELTLHLAKKDMESAKLKSAFINSQLMARSPSLKYFSQGYVESIRTLARRILNQFDMRNAN